MKIVVVKKTELYKTSSILFAANYIEPGEYYTYTPVAINGRLSISLTEENYNNGIRDGWVDESCVIIPN